MGIESITSVTMTVPSRKNEEKKNRRAVRDKQIEGCNRRVKVRRVFRQVLYTRHKQDFLVGLTFSTDPLPLPRHHVFSLNSLRKAMSLSLRRYFQLTNIQTHHYIQ